MKLKLTLLAFCLLGIGLFSHAQTVKKDMAKPIIEDGANAGPAMVFSNKKAHRKFAAPADKNGKFSSLPKPMMAPPPPVIARNGKPLPPPKIVVEHFKAPAMPPPPPPKVDTKHFKAPAVPPPPAPVKKDNSLPPPSKPVAPDAPPPPNAKA